MKIGDRVEVVAMPKVLQDDATRALFTRCLGRHFPVARLRGHLIELEVGEVVEKPSYMHSIWIERDCVRLI